MITKAIKDWNTVIDDLPDFISIIDTENKFVKVNRALADFLGVEQEDLIGQPCYKSLHGTDKPLPNCPHIKMIELKQQVTEKIDDPHIGFSLLVIAEPIKENDKLIGGVHIAVKCKEH